MARQVLYPKKIVTSQLVDSLENLFEKQNLQIDLKERHFALFHKGSSLILDFGKEMRGGIRVLTFASDSTPIRIRFGESVAECCDELVTSTNDHAIRDMQVTLPSWSDTQIGDTGFRFVRLDFSGEYAIKSIVCINHILSKRAKYVYHGEKEVEEIFKAAKRTIDLCASSGYIWDGVKRDRLVWAGDLAPEILALTTLYGKCPEIENSIDFVREATPLPDWMDNITTYSLWWILILKDYLAHTDAYDFVGKQMDYLEELIAQVLEGVDEQGNMNYPSYFLDWPRAGYMEEREGFRAVAIMASDAAVDLLDRYGRDSTNAKECFERLKRQEIHPTTKVVAAFKQLAVGDLSAEEQELLLSGGSLGMSTFMGYYVLKAVAMYDRTLAWNIMKEYYGAMLSLGSTTFWEEFDVEWASYGRIDQMPDITKKCAHGDTGMHCYTGYRKSLCHGWAAGVIRFIKEYGEQER